MPNMQPLFYTNEKHAKTQLRELEFIFQITAAKTVVVYPRGADILPLFDATTQAVIDAYLGTTNEFLLAQFDATSMGTDAFGGIINMGTMTSPGTYSSSLTAQAGQAAALVSVEVSTQSGTSFGTWFPTAAFGPTGLASTSLTTGCALGANGNIAFRAILTGVDALTSGLIKVVVKWIAT